MSDFIEEFTSTNQSCLQSGTLNVALLIMLSKIHSVETFINSDAINATAKKAFVRSVQNVLLTQSSRVFVTQGIVEPIAVNIDTEIDNGHPFDACPLYGLKFLIFPNGDVEPYTDLHYFKRQVPLTFV